MGHKRLDSVNTFDQFGYDHWKALGTIVGGVEVVKRVLRNELKVRVSRNPYGNFEPPYADLFVTKQCEDLMGFFTTQELLDIPSPFQEVLSVYTFTRNNKRIESFNHLGIKLWLTSNDINIGALREEVSVDRGFSPEVKTFLCLLYTFLTEQKDGCHGTLPCKGTKTIFPLRILGEECFVGIFRDTEKNRWACLPNLVDETVLTPGDVLFLL